RSARDRDEGIMMRATTQALEAHVLGEGDWIAAAEICQLCRLDLEAVLKLATLGVVSSRERAPGEWQGPGSALPRRPVARPLQRGRAAARPRVWWAAGAAGGRGARGRSRASAARSRTSAAARGFCTGPSISPPPAPPARSPSSSTAFLARRSGRLRWGKRP